MLTSRYRGRGKEDALKGLTSDYQLTLPAMLRRAEALYGPKEIVTRRPDKCFHRYTYADFVRRAKRLAVALGDLGLEKSERVATLAWNNHQHLEAYFGVPCAGLVLHTINPRLFPDQIAYIANHAEDRYLFTDPMFLPLLEELDRRPDVDWACAASVVVDASLHIIGAQHPPRAGELPGSILRYNAVPGGASAVLARTELVRELGGFDPKLRILVGDVWWCQWWEAIPADGK